ncbi:MAG TPA: transporter substrate-binding domain-containing protein [Telmatospirillum sp.]|nr:transporter substrate-binding domain-containing protein [Telmatospirillum sp.]
MHVSIKSILLPVLLILPFVAFAQNTTITVYAPDGPPQASAADERGIMADAALEALRRAGLTGKITFVPWKRAQEDVAAGKDLLITGFSRTPEREDRYTWLFSVFTMNNTFASLGKPINSFADVKIDNKQVVAVLGAAQHKTLLDEGVPAGNITTVTNILQKNVPDMMVSGRIDAWFSSDAEIKYFLKGRADAGKFVIGPPLSSAKQYVACSKDCSPELVAKMKKVGAEMKADGTLATIIARYQ